MYSKGVHIIIDNSGSMKKGSWKKMIKTLVTIVGEWKNETAFQLSPWCGSQTHGGLMSDINSIEKLTSWLQQRALRPNGSGTPIIDKVLEVDPTFAPFLTLLITDGFQKKYQTWQNLLASNLTVSFLNENKKEEKLSVKNAVELCAASHQFDVTRLDIVTGVITLQSLLNGDNTGVYARVLLVTNAGGGEAFEELLLEPPIDHQTVRNFTRSILSREHGGAADAYNSFEIREKQRLRIRNVVLNGGGQTAGPTWSFTDSYEVVRQHLTNLYFTKPNGGTHFTSFLADRKRRTAAWADLATTLAARQRIARQVREDKFLSDRVAPYITRRVTKRYNRRHSTSDPIMEVQDAKQLVIDNVALLYGPQPTSVPASQRLQQLLTEERTRRHLVDAFSVFTSEVPAHEIFNTDSQDTVHDYLKATGGESELRTHSYASMSRCSRVDVLAIRNQLQRIESDNLNSLDNLVTAIQYVKWRVRNRLEQVLKDVDALTANEERQLQQL